MSSYRRIENLSLAEIDRVAFVEGQYSEGVLGTILLVLLMFVPLIPDLLEIDRVDRWRRRRALDNHPRPVEVVQFTASRAWWLKGGTNHGLVLMLEVESESDEFILLGAGWPPSCTPTLGAHSKWIIYRSVEDHVVLGTRAWGRCRTSCANVPPAVLPLEDVNVTTGQSLAPALRALLGSKGPYR